MGGFEDWFNQKAKIIAGTVVYSQVVHSLHQSLKDEGFDDEQAMRVLDITMRHVTRMMPELIRVFNEMNQTDD